MKPYLKPADIERIRETLPDGVLIEVDDPLTLRGGDVFTFRLVKDMSVVVFIDGDSDYAHRCQMPLFWVEEDRYEPRWRGEFGSLDNAVKWAVGFLIGTHQQAPTVQLDEMTH
jgi:hypothetical protein